MLRQRHRKERTMADLLAQFEAAAADAPQLPARPNNETLLKLYALYKQATKGDVSGGRPGMLAMVERAKYDAWAAIKGMAKEAAMQAYVDTINRLKGDG
jgi:diazepam-binding inhibitor (GABA receptor modulator, acyl-CoA-binding protein)